MSYHVAWCVMIETVSMWSTPEFESDPSQFCTLTRYPHGKLTLAAQWECIWTGSCSQFRRGNAAVCCPEISFPQHVSGLLLFSVNIIWFAQTESAVTGAASMWDFYSPLSFCEHGSKIVMKSRFKFVLSIKVKRYRLSGPTGPSIQSSYWFTRVPYFSSIFIDLDDLVLLLCLFQKYKRWL